MDPRTLDTDYETSLCAAVGELGDRARELLREITRSMKTPIHAELINSEHVHLLIGIALHRSES
jgi:REP element-mobilizing transposase RayT